MISNLLSNAVKYSDREPEIKVTSAASGNDLDITVADNGVGIPAEHLGHIFEKFYRVPQGNIHKTKGLGLGLYYVRRIAEAHGGDVSVTSKPGRGTTFKIKIPIQNTL
jgi:signal transduction histidine kinase